MSYQITISGHVSGSEEERKEGEAALLAAAQEFISSIGSATFGRFAGSTVAADLKVGDSPNDQSIGNVQPSDASQDSESGQEEFSSPPEQPADAAPSE